MENTVNSISGFDKSPDLGIIFAKAITIETADFDKYLNEIDPTLFAGEEIFALITILDDPSITYDVALEYIDGSTNVVTWMAWTPMLIRARKILSAGTTATKITVLGGQ